METTLVAKSEDPFPEALKTFSKPPRLPNKAVNKSKKMGAPNRRNIQTPTPTAVEDDLELSSSDDDSSGYFAGYSDQSEYTHLEDLVTLGFVTIEDNTTSDDDDRPSSASSSSESDDDDQPQQAVVADGKQVAAPTKGKRVTFVDDLDDGVAGAAIENGKCGIGWMGTKEERPKSSKPCIFYARRRCLLGSHCSFSHEQSDMDKVEANVRRRRRK